MRNLWLSLIFLLIGCRSGEVNVPQSTPVERRASVLYVGMSFTQAEALLKQYGAKETGFEVVLGGKLDEKGGELHYWHLATGGVLELISLPDKSGRIVASVAINRYRPKSWNSKQDPEYDKFHRSYKGVREIDLDQSVVPSGTIEQPKDH